MNRREFVRVAGTSALALSASPLRSQPSHPNVLFVVMDDMNDWIGCLGGHPQALTPNLDAFAQSGVLFTNAHANSTECIPSRCSFISGMRPSSTGIYSNFQDWRDYIPNANMMPMNFSNNGYFNLRSGKFFHESENDMWDEYADRGPSAQPPTYPATGFPFERDYFKYFDWTPVDVPDGRTRNGRYTDWAISKLEQNFSQPFFMALGLTTTHDPWYYPRKYFEPFPLESIQLPEVPADELDDIPEIGRNVIAPEYHDSVVKQQQWRKAVQAYLASIYFADTLFGRVMDSLESSPYADETIVVFTSDHALHLGEKFHWRKFALWREDTHVPLIIRAPGITPPEGGVHSYAAELLDLYPTLIDLCDLDPVPEAEGVSFRSRLLDPSTLPDRPALITTAYDRHAIVDERWRYIRYENGAEELYDHDVDPREHTNLAGDPSYQSVIDDLSQWLPEVNIEP